MVHSARSLSSIALTAIGVCWLLISDVEGFRSQGRSCRTSEEASIDPTRVTPVEAVHRQASHLTTSVQPSQPPHELRASSGEVPSWLKGRFKGSWE